MIIKAKYRLKNKLVARILALKNSIEPIEAYTRRDNQERDNIERDSALRKTEIRWLTQEKHDDVFQAILAIASEHQARLSVFRRMRVEPFIQLSTYREGDHYGWHQDGTESGGSRRIVSMSVLLSERFEGGQLEFSRPGAPRLRKPGDVVLFNSDELHRVTPVTKGVRDSLVVWLTPA